MNQGIMTAFWSVTAHDFALARLPHLTQVAVDETRRMSKVEGVPEPADLPIPDFTGCHYGPAQSAV